MSASQHKKKRRQEVEQAAAGQEKKNSSRGAWIAGGIFAAALVLAAIFFGLMNSGIFEHWTTAATVGTHKVSPAMYNFFQGKVRQENGGVSGSELQEKTKEEMARTYAAYDMALSEGIVLTAEQKQNLEADVANLDSYAAYAGYPSAAAYLTGMYGKGCDIKRYREYMELNQVVSLYNAEHRQNTVFSDEEIDGFYASHREDYDTVSYRSFICGSEEEANAFADAVQGDEDAFAGQARQNAPEGEEENYESDDATLYRDQTLSSLPSELQSWLADPSRVNGDAKAVESGGAWMAVQFVDNWTKYEDQELIDVRHILISAGGDITAEQARAKAEEILAEYQAGEQTEESFGELAKKYSADGNAAQGGIYEGVVPGQMVDTFNDWCFDPSRQAGDTGIVETQFGAHVMYFVGESGRQFYYNDVLDTLHSRELDAWMELLGSKITVTTNDFGMQFTSK